MLSGVEFLEYLEGDCGDCYSDLDEEENFERIGADAFDDEEYFPQGKGREDDEDPKERGKSSSPTIFVTNRTPELKFVPKRELDGDTICEFCYDSFSKEVLFVRLPCSRVLCKSCLDTYIDTKLNLQGIRDIENHIMLVRQDNCIELQYAPFCIKCPYLNCKCCITQGMLNKYNTAKATKFEKLVCLAILTANPELTYCPYCDQEGNECYPVKGILGQQCVKCNMVHCKTCRKEPHPGFSCKRRNYKRVLRMKQRNRYLLAQRKELLKLLSENWKFDWRECPHCREFVEKNGGCNHMYCTKCHKNFDWGTAFHFSKLSEEQLFSYLDTDFLMRLLPLTSMRIQ